MYVMETVEDLWEHIAYVIMCAPDDFPREDFLSGDQQMNLEHAFEQLREGVGIAYPEDEFVEKRTTLNELLDDSYSRYRTGDVNQARNILEQFQNSIFKE
jgi:hypothetical protein